MLLDACLDDIHWMKKVLFWQDSHLNHISLKRQHQFVELALQEHRGHPFQ